MTYAYEALDYRFTVEGLGASEPAVEAAIGRLRGDVSPDVTYRLDPVDAAWELRKHDTVLSCAPTVDGVVYAMLADVNGVAATSVESAVAVHAGAVVRRTVVLVSGASGSGKTTLTARLVEAGAGYLTDECAALDTTTLHVRPYPKGLSVKRGSPLFPAGCPDDVDVVTRDIGEISAAAWQAGPAPVGVIVQPRFVRGSASDIERVPRAEMVLHLSQNTSSLAAKGAAAVGVLVDVVRAAECVRVTFGDARSAVEALDREGLLA
jgi:hypothetical protein